MGVLNFLQSRRRIPVTEQAPSLGDSITDHCLGPPPLSAPQVTCALTCTCLLLPSLPSLLPLPHQLYITHGTIALVWLPTGVWGQLDWTDRRGEGQGLRNASHSFSSKQRPDRAWRKGPWEGGGGHESCRYWVALN